MVLVLVEIVEKEKEVPHRGQHANVVAEVPYESDDAHPLSEALDLAEEEHEAVFLSQLLQRSPLLLILTQQLTLGLGGQEAHQTLHEVHRQGLQIKPAIVNAHVSVPMTPGGVIQEEDKSERLASFQSTLS